MDADNAAAAPASRPSNVSSVSAHIAANIPPPSPMNMNGDWSDNWDLFRAEFEDYALVMGLAEKTKEVQAATLRSVMGPECRHVYRHNLNLTAAQQGDVKTILESLDVYFKPAKNVIYERYVFGCCKQEERESIDNFVTRLREKAATCDYGGLKDEMIRDKIVLGITNEGTRRRLLSEKKLTLLTAIEMCRTAEQTAIRMRAMDVASMPSAETVHAVARKPFKSNQRKQSNSPRLVDTSRTCRYCGNVHSRGRDCCPAYGKTCRLCGTNNHFAKVCLKSKSKPTEGKLHCIEDSNEGQVGDSDDDIYTVESISTVHMERKKWFVSLRLDGKTLRCQLDSGATCNVMSYKDKVKVAPHTPLRHSNVKLRLYSGESLNSMGVFDTDCVVQGRKYHLSFEIVETSQSPLLSGSTCEQLGLMQFTIPDDVLKMEHEQYDPLTKTQLMDKYSDVFNLPVESLPGEVHFELDPSVSPVQCAPRNVSSRYESSRKSPTGCISGRGSYHRCYGAD